MMETATSAPAGPPTQAGRPSAETPTGSPTSGSKWDRPPGNVNPDLTETHDKPLTQANGFVIEVAPAKQTHAVATTRPPTKKQKRIRWTKDEQVDLYRCYCEAKLLKLPLTKGTYEIWRKKNPSSRPNTTQVTLSTQRRYVENNSLTEIEIEKIWELAKKEIQSREESEPDQVETENSPPRETETDAREGTPEADNVEEAPSATT